MASGIKAAHALIQDVTGYAFYNSSLLEGALDTTGLHSTGSNERLAMLGDSRLKDVILDDWYPTATTKGMSATK
jgi:dsRNA-specific ribonuclease